MIEYNKENYLMYLRKSRSDRDMHDASTDEILERHYNILQRFCEQQKYNVVKIFKEVVSGESIATRPEVQKLLSLVETGEYDGVIVLDIERLGRGNTIDQGIISQTFSYSATKIITPTKTYDPSNEYDRDYFEDDMYYSRKEYKKITRRLTRGREAASTEGKFCGNIPPFGYEKYKLEGSRGNSLRKTPEAKVISDIFNWYNGINCERIGICLIARQLNDMKVPTAKSSTWTSSTISSILKNPVYAGFIRWNYRKAEKSVKDGKIIVSRPKHDETYTLVPGLHEPIISKELFDATQSLLKQNQRSVPINARSDFKNPLASLVFCSKCGRRMMRRPYVSKNTEDTLMCIEPQCPTVSSKLRLVETEILDFLNNYSSALTISDDLHNEEFFKIDYMREQISCLEDHISTLHDSAERLYDFLEQGIYSVDIFQHRKAKIESEIESDKNEIASYQKTIDKYELKKEQLNTFIPRSRKLLDNYKFLTPLEKNTALKSLIDHVEYSKDTRNERGCGDDITFKLKIFPKI